MVGGCCAMLSNAQEAGTKARLAYAHWECYLYLNYAGSEETENYRNNREKHFLEGLKHVREMMAELKEYGDKNNKNWYKTAPSFFRRHLSGPNEDFVAGKLFQATNQLVKENLDAESSIEDLFPENLEIIASNKYSSSNCNIIALSGE